MVPLSAKSFPTYGTGKDTAAIGAILKTSVRCIRLFLQALQTPFSHILVTNEDDGKDNGFKPIALLVSKTAESRNSTFGVRHSIFKNDSLLNNEYRLTNNEYRSFSFVQINENRNSTFDVHHSIFNNNKKNYEYRLTNDECRSFSFVKTTATRNSKFDVQHICKAGDTAQIIPRCSIISQHDGLVTDSRHAAIHCEALKAQYLPLRNTGDTKHRPRLQRGRARRAFVTPKQKVNTFCFSNSATKLRTRKNSPDCSGYNVELAEHYLSGKRERSLIEIQSFCFKKLNNYKQFEN